MLGIERGCGMGKVRFELVARTAGFTKVDWLVEWMVGVLAMGPTSGGLECGEPYMVGW